MIVPVDIGMVVVSPSGRVEVLNSVVRDVKVSAPEVASVSVVPVITASTTNDVEAIWEAAEVCTEEVATERAEMEVNGELTVTELIVVLL